MSEQERAKGANLATYSTQGATGRGAVCFLLGCIRLFRKESAFAFVWHRRAPSLTNIDWITLLWDDVIISSALLVTLYWGNERQRLWDDTGRAFQDGHAITVESTVRRDVCRNSGPNNNLIDLFDESGGRKRLVYIPYTIYIMNAIWWDKSSDAFGPFRQTLSKPAVCFDTHRYSASLKAHRYTFLEWDQIGHPSKC